MGNGKTREKGTTMATWEKNDGYSACLTAYKGDLAVVIAEPATTGEGWEIQVFDEADEDAMDRGETICRVELGRWIEEEDAVAAAEKLFF